MCKTMLVVTEGISVKGKSERGVHIGTLECRTLSVKEVSYI